METWISHTSKRTDVENDWDLGRTLGVGAFSVVKEGQSRTSAAKCAVKIIEKSKLRGSSFDLLKSEVTIMQQIAACPNVVQLQGCYESSAKIWIILELIPGGELFDKIQEKEFFCESDGSKIIGAVLKGLGAIHKLNIAHRDMKLENILCGSKDFNDVSDVKIADFGISAAVPVGGTITGPVGTPNYAAPEVVSNQNYGIQCDMWSMGVISYMVLGGYAPFENKVQAELNRIICLGKFEFHSPEWDEVGPIARDFISQLLKTNPEERMTAEQALQHKFILTAEEQSKRVNEAAKERFAKTHAAAKKLKATFQSVIAQNRMMSFASALSKLKTSETAAQDDKKNEHPQEILLTPKQVLNKDQAIQPPSSERPTIRVFPKDFNKPAQVAESFTLPTVSKQVIREDLPRHLVPSSLHMNFCNESVKIFREQIVYDKLGEPTVTWDLEPPSKSGPHIAQIYYETEKLTWEPRFEAIFKGADKGLDITGYFDITNFSGLSYTNPQLSLVYENGKAFTHDVKFLFTNQFERIPYLTLKAVPVKNHLVRLPSLSPPAWLPAAVGEYRFSPSEFNPGLAFETKFAHHTCYGHHAFVVDQSTGFKTHSLATLRSVPVSLHRVHGDSPTTVHVCDTTLRASPVDKGHCIRIGLDEDKTLVGFRNSQLEIGNDGITESVTLLTPGRPTDIPALFVDTLFRFPKFQILKASHENKVSGHDIIFQDLKANQPVTYTVKYEF